MIINNGGQFKFAGSSDDRMYINDIGDGDFMLCNMSVGNIFINRDDIDDMIELLTKVRENGYAIE